LFVYFFVSGQEHLIESKKFLKALKLQIAMRKSITWCAMHLFFALPWTTQDQLEALIGKKLSIR
jgi:hypothetical protein